jgi:hypothetical protein
MQVFRVAAAVMCLAFATPSAQSPERRACVTFPNGTPVAVEIADTELSRGRRLMFRGVCCPCR